MKLRNKLLLLALLIPQLALADETVSLGLTLKIPSQGQTNWGTLFKEEFAEPISSHDHTGGGNGTQISTNGIASNAISGAKIRLANDQYLRARNAANSADLDIVKVSAADKIRFATANVSADTRADLGLAIGTNVQAYDAELGEIAALADTDSNFIVGNGSAWVAESGATARTSLGLAIGTDVQAYDADLTALGGLAKTDSNIIVGDGSTWVAESGATARTSLGVGTGDSPTFTGLTLTGSLTSPIVTTASTLSLRATGANVILLQTNGTNRWSVDSDGRYNPQADDSYEIGSSVNTLKNLWIKKRTWVPTLASEAGSVNTPTIFYARYTRVGNLIFWETMVGAASVSASSDYITATSPSTGATLAAGSGVQGGGCQCYVGSTFETCSWTVGDAGTTIIFRRAAGNDWPGSTVWGVACNGFYEEA